MITNQRMIFMSMEKNITVKLQDLVQANTFYDGIKLADDENFATSSLNLCNQIHHDYHQRKKQVKWVMKNQEKFDYGSFCE